MTGHVRKRGQQWEVVLELGKQPAQRCEACMARKGRTGGRLLWIDDERHESCPKCGGELDDVEARRQIVLPDRYRTKKEATARLEAEKRAEVEGTFAEPSELTLGAYLANEWLPALAGEELTTGTVRVYTGHVEQRIVPVLGRVPLQKITARHVKQLRTHMATHEGVRGSIPSAQTRKQTLIVLHKALGAAVHDGLIGRNPATGVRRPRVPKREMRFWSAEQLRIFLASTEGSRLYPVWRFLSQTGLRRGEALGLMLDSLDLDAGKAMISRQRKQDGYRAVDGPLKVDARRTVSLDAGTVEALRGQLQQQLEDAKAWGEAWQATGYVFTREDGSPWHPDRVTKLFNQAVKAAALPRLRLHDLRHPWATRPRRAGVHIKIVSERLGHKNIAMTLDLYSHALPDLGEAAAELVASLVDAPQE